MRSSCRRERSLPLPRLLLSVLAFGLHLLRNLFRPRVQAKLQLLELEFVIDLFEKHYRGHLLRLRQELSASALADSHGATACNYCHASLLYLALPARVVVCDEVVACGVAKSGIPARVDTVMLATAFL